MRFLVTAALTAATLATPLPAQTHQPVLLISIDGMRPDYVTRADEHHLRIPNLRRMLAQGTHATGVLGVFPTLTYPSHTTLVTGVTPREHGIDNNDRFDPLQQFTRPWFWYAPMIQVPTLWDAAHAAGLSTASVGWPVTVDAPTIDILIPEYWRGNLGDPANPDDRALMDALAFPRGELNRIAHRTGQPYMSDNNTDLAGDETKTLYTLDILQQHHPDFLTLHLSALDEDEHEHGPFSPQANRDLEALDAMVGRLAAQELAVHPNAVIAVVSDHGFAPISHQTNLYIPFLAAGLITVSDTREPLHVTSWLAQPWFAGGMAAIMLHDPADTATRDKVRILLDKLAADPASGVEAVLDPTQVAALGGLSEAAFVVTLKSGYHTGSSLTGPLVTETPGRGTHGYNPATTPEMRSALFLTGQGVAPSRDLGLIDMRQIAPTLARILGIQLPTAKQPPLPVHCKPVKPPNHLNQTKQATSTCHEISPGPL